MLKWKFINFFKVSKLQEEIIICKLRLNKTRHLVALKSIVPLSIFKKVINLLEERTSYEILSI